MLESELEVLLKMNVFIQCSFLRMEPKIIEDALTNPDWVVAIQEELNQFEHHRVCKLVPRPKKKKVIDTRWVFRNKLDEECIVTRNKARLVEKRVFTS